MTQIAKCIFLKYYLFQTLQTYGGCYKNYDMQLSYYPQSDQVTHDLLQKFYHGLILHQRFIMERMLDRELLKEIRIQKDIYDLLKSVANELEYNIARLYHLVSGYNLE